MHKKQLISYFLMLACCFILFVTFWSKTHLEEKLNTEIHNGFQIEGHSPKNMNNVSSSIKIHFSSYNNLLSSQKNTNDFFKNLSTSLLIEDSYRRIHRIRTLLTELTKKYSIDETIYWLSLQEPTTEIGEYFYYVLKNFMTTDMNKAGDIILRLDNFDTKNSIINDYVYQLTLLDPLSALAWCDNIVDSSYKKYAQLQIFKTWGTLDAEQALDYLSSFSELESSIKNEVIIQAANNLTRNNYLHAIDDLYQYPTPYQPKIAYSIISHWPENNFLTAVNWINTLETGQTKDLAIQSYVDNIGLDNNPKETFRLIAKISDKKLQLLLAKRLFSSWYQQAPEAASEELPQLSYIPKYQYEHLIENSQQKAFETYYRWN